MLFSTFYLNNYVCIHKFLDVEIKTNDFKTKKKDHDDCGLVLVYYCDRFRDY